MVRWQRLNEGQEQGQALKAIFSRYQGAHLQPVSLTIQVLCCSAKEWGGCAIVIEDFFSSCKNSLSSSSPASKILWLQ